MKVGSQKTTIIGFIDSGQLTMEEVLLVLGEKKCRHWLGPTLRVLEMVMRV